MPSTSYATLIARLKEVGRIVCSSPRLPTGLPANPDLEKAVTRAGVVLLCSHLEGYVKDLVVEAVDALNASSIAVTALPDNLRQVQCQGDLDALAETENPVGRRKHLERFFAQHSAFWAPGATLQRGVLRAEPIIGRLASPKPNKIAKLFDTLGVVDILGVSQKYMPRADHTQLVALVDKRNDIAHGGFGSTPTRQDVMSYLKHTSWFCKAVDKVVRQHIERLTGTSPW